MQKQIYRLDDGVNFGTWGDPVSHLMYEETKRFVLNIHYNTVADYGGANGLMGDCFPNSTYITIDTDPTKSPDIVGNIITHRGDYDLIVLRYVLHYLTDIEAVSMLDNIKQHHTGDILVIQFVNDGVDLELKKQVSNMVNEDSHKVMRNTPSFFNLLKPFSIKSVNSLDCVVTPEFYKNRLGIDTTINHRERIYGVLCTR